MLGGSFFSFKISPPKQPTPIDWIQTCGGGGKIVSLHRGFMTVTRTSERRSTFKANLQVTSSS